MAAFEDAEISRRDVLRRLGFGPLDAESDPDLSARFVRTEDFDEFLAPLNVLVLGPKGTGKSALFELFTKYEGTARAFAPHALKDVIITAATGFSDLTEVDTGSIESLRQEDGYSHESLWRLYIALRAALAVSNLENLPSGPLREFSKAVGGKRDWRLAPILKQLWRALISDKLPTPRITVRGVEIDFSVGGQDLDVTAMLQEVNRALDIEGKHLWVLFDKIDELFPTDPNERLRALEGLVLTAMEVRRTFPRIQPRIFLRTDLWRHLHFTNKSHLEDKKVDLAWSAPQMARLLLKRAVTDEAVWNLAAEQEEQLLEVVSVEDLSDEQVATALTSIFPSSVYAGVNEASFVSWLVPRITDGLGTVLPREAIYLANQARAAQIATGGPATETLLSGKSVLTAYREMSEMRVRSYLAEFPDVSKHILRFEGLTTSTFTRQELNAKFDGLEPSGDDLLRELCEIGLLKPGGRDIATSESFDVPQLYRQGLGLVIRGRP
ncbi:P-loop ATPase, Sll1717 family [Aeromicrobium yanjiei]|uniref:Uncharacterized protein n=1 Tax=Aeromicrobium yanjiei TaxID=2662028 RepID=A0A5Q2MHV6_9ACTN|nr:hypothetical protein [Aeromicrobium yanjiei]QGG39895.1 hypothetical protein GEV26_00050 [Aeromicrobium yanjiei]